MTLEELLHQPQALPSAPGIVKELIQSFEDENISLQDISRKISADQVLTVKLLRLANSAHYHVSRTIGTVDQAVTLLGFLTVRTLVISTGLTGSFKSIKGINPEYFWRYSLHSAVVAKWLARKTHQNLETAFTIGLMHAIGELVMRLGMPDKCEQMDKMIDFWSLRRLEMERIDFGYGYDKVSAALASHWGFPSEFISTLEMFSDPLAEEPVDRLAVIVHLATWFARAYKNGLSVEDMEADFPTEIAEVIGLTFAEVNEEMPSLDELSGGLDVLIAG